MNHLADNTTSIFKVGCFQEISQSCQQLFFRLGLSKSLWLRTTLISFKANDVIFGAVQSRGSNSVDVFGDVWLWNVYAIYDLATTGTPRFGFVPRNESFNQTSQQTTTSDHHSGAI